MVRCGPVRQVRLGEVRFGKVRLILIIGERNGKENRNESIGNPTN